MTDAAVANNTDDKEAMRIAMDDRVKAAKKALEDAEKAAIISAKPTITEFAGFLNKQNGLQVGMFNIRGENLGYIGPQGVTLNGHMAKVTAIRADRIKGVVPQDIKAGPVKIKAGEATFEGSIA